MTKPKKQAYSGRGGERENAGRPSTWNHSPTTAVRVPEPLVKQILIYAHELDSGAVQNQTDVSEQISELINKWQTQTKATRDWTKCNKLLQELQNIIITTNS
jgi:gas vesicle protein